MGTRQKLRRNLKKFTRFERARPGLMGDGTGRVAVDGFVDTVWVRNADGTNPRRVYNKRVGLENDLPVWIGKDPQEPNFDQVLGSRFVSQNSEEDAPKTASVPPHRETHEWMGSDIVFVNVRQMMPARPTARGQELQISPANLWMQGSLVYLSGQYFDLEPYTPLTGACFALVYADANGVVQASAGAIKDTLTLNYPQDVPPTVNGTVPLAVVRLYDLQTGTGIVEARQYTDLSDVRPWFTEVITGSAYGNQGGGPTIVEWHLDGWLATGTQVGKTYVMPIGGTLGTVYAYVENAGLTGTTRIDLNKNGVSILSSPIEIVYNSSDRIGRSVPLVTTFITGDYLTLDIDEAAEGSKSLTLTLAVNGTAGSSMGTPTLSDLSENLPTASEGQLFLPTDVPLIQRKNSNNTWSSWGPIHPLLGRPPATGWTAVTGTATAVFRQEDGFLEVIDNGNVQYSSVWVRNKPTPPFKVTFALNTTNTFASANSTIVFFRESSTDKMVCFRLVYDGNVYVQYYANRAGNTTNLWGPGVFRFDTSGTFLFVQLEDDGVNRYYRVSKDGRNFYTLYTQANDSYFTSDQIGFGVHHENYLDVATLIGYKEE